MALENKLGLTSSADRARDDSGKEILCLGLSCSLSQGAEYGYARGDRQLMLIYLQCGNNIHALR